MFILVLMVNLDMYTLDFPVLAHAQDPFWKETQVIYKAKKAEIDNGTVACYDLAVKVAKKFLKNLPAV